MKRSGKEKYIKWIGITLIAMATVFIGMGQAAATTVVSTFGNEPYSYYNIGNLSGQALTTGQSITATSVTFMYGSNTPSTPFLTIMDADSSGRIGSNTIDTWESFGTPGGNLLTFTGSTTLSPNETFWFLVSDTAPVYLRVAHGSDFVANFGATLPDTFNNVQGNGTYFSLIEYPLMFEVQGNPVPIPGALVLFGSGLLGLVGIGRKRLLK